MEELRKQLNGHIDKLSQGCEDAYKQGDKKTIKIINKVNQFKASQQRFYISFIDLLLELLNEGSDILLCAQQYRLFRDGDPSYRKTFIACLVVLVIEFSTRIVGAILDINECKGNIIPPLRQYKDDANLSWWKNKYLALFCAIVEHILANIIFYKDISKNPELTPNNETSWMKQDCFKLYNESMAEYSARQFLFFLFLLEDLPGFCIEIAIWIYAKFEGEYETKFWTFVFSLVTTVMHIGRHIWRLWAAWSAQKKLIKHWIASISCYLASKFQKYYERKNNNMIEESI